MAPQIMHLAKRSTGARVGLGVGIAVACILVVLIVVFVFVHTRRSKHIDQVDRERALYAEEKNADGSLRGDKFSRLGSESSGSSPKRNRSVREKLMAPIYRGSTIDLMPIPKAAHVNGRQANRGSTLTINGNSNNNNRWSNMSTHSFLQKPWNRNSSTPSFSSKRATRMMMMM